MKLPRSIDWDLLAEEDGDPELLKAAGPSQEHVRLALTTPDMAVMDELGKKTDTKARMTLHCTFVSCAPGE